MTHSKHTNQIRLSSQSSSRQGAARTHVLWHHTASVSGRGEGVVNMMVNKTREVSSNYVLGSDGYIWLVVDEDLRAWTSGSSTDGGKGAAWDRKSITHECSNATGAPSWLQSDAFYESAAKLALDYYERYGIPLDRDHHIGHRELYTRFGASYPTACPGGMDIDRILNQAKALMDPGAVERDRAMVRAIAAYLNGLKLGDEFGVPGLRSAAAEDGIRIDPGSSYSRYYHLMQMWGRKFRPDIYSTAHDIDGIPGPVTRSLEPLVWAAAQVVNPPKPVDVKVGDQVSVPAAFGVYSSVAAAKAGGTPSANYAAGTYWVYKISDLYVNLGKAAGKAGGWVLASSLNLSVPAPEPEPEPVKKFKVTIDGGAPVEVEENKLIPIPEIVEKPGFTFAYWEDATKPGTAFDFSTRVTRDYSLLSVYEEIPPVFYGVTFTATDFEYTQRVKEGDYAQAIPVPPLVGHDPIGWNDEAGDPYMFNVPVTKDVRLHAVYVGKPVEPNPGDETPGWFKRFLEAIVDAIKKFLGIGTQ